MLNNMSTGASQQQQMYNNLMSSSHPSALSGAMNGTMNSGSGVNGAMNGGISSPAGYGGYPSNIQPATSRRPNDSAAEKVLPQYMPGSGGPGNLSNYMTSPNTAYSMASQQYPSNVAPQQQQQQPGIQTTSSSSIPTTQPSVQQQAPRQPRSRGESKQPVDIHEEGYRRPSLGKMEGVAVEIVQDPSDFTCLLSKYFDDVDVLNDEMDRIYATAKDYGIPSSKAKIGMACVAPFLQDDAIRYYRAVIVAIKRNEADVFFVDYGNIDSVPLKDLKYLLKTFAETPESVIKCSFDSVAPADGATTWGSGALQAFKAYFVDTINFQCLIKGENSQGPGYRVELYPESGDVEQPISKELERRGVLVCISDNRNANNNAATRGRRQHRSSGNNNTAETDYKRATPRERGRDRSESPAGSAANTELIRAGYRPPSIDMKGYTDVRVYACNTPGKFSCQLLANKDKLDQLYDHMQTYYDKGDELDLLDDTNPFTSCVVFKDGKWHRAYIVSSSYHGCQVVLIDTQEYISVDQQQLRTVDEEFRRFPAQGVKCSLDGIVPLKANTWNSETCRYFQGQVSDIDLIAQFRSEKNGVMRVLLHSNRGGVDLMINAMFVVKGYASPTDNVVKQAVENVTTAINDNFSMYKVKIGTSLTVSPCHVESPEEFYVHPVDEQENIEDLQDKVNEYYERNSTDKLQLQVDSYCVALWDDSWYRARIVSISRSECEVFFVDFGNTDTVEIRNLKGLSKQFKKQPMYAIKCKLEGITDMESVKDIFLSLVDVEIENPLHAMFIKLQKGHYLVSLYDGTVSILQRMYKKLYHGDNMASSTRPSTRPRKAHGPPPVEIEDRCLVQISHADHPHLLYLHSNSNSKTLENLSSDMNNTYNSPGSKQSLRMKQVGELCAALYSEDGEWYRGRIEAIHGEQVQVQFIDYGNEQSIRSNEIFELDRKFRELPAQASPASLSGIKEPPHGWADVRDELLQCEDMQFTVKITDDDISPITVELFNVNTGGSLARELINNGYGIEADRRCIPMPQVTSIGGGTFEVKVCYADFPGRIFIQKMSQAQPLEDMMTKLVTDYEQNQPRLQEDIKIGSVCCVLYTEDQCYYRATVYGITRINTKIQFCDFGNCEDKNSSELFHLKDEYLSVSAQAIECRLHGCDINSTKWTPAMQQYLEGLVFEKTYNCQVVGRVQEQYEIRLHEMKTGNGLADEINRFVEGGAVAPPAGQNTGFAAPSSAPAPAPAPKTDEVVKIEWPPRIDKFNHVPAMISWGDGPEDFWINLVDNEGKLDQLQERLQTVYGSGGRQPGRIFRYMYVAVKSPEFGEIFRGKTLNNDRNCPTIVYVDYGNEEDVPVSNVYDLESYLASVLPCQAIHCALDGLDRLKPEGELKPELKAKFEELLSEKVIEVKNICPAQREKPHNEIEIMVGGQSIMDILEKELIALSGPPDVELCTAKIGNVLKCAITNIVSPTGFWCQIAGHSSKINELTKTCTDRLTEVPALKTYCAVVLGDDDETVYRAQVLQEGTANNVIVRCIDYGYKHEVTLKQLYKLKTPCAELPAQAFPCTMPVEIADENAEAALTVMKTVAEKCVTVKLYSNKDERFVVDFVEPDHVTLFGEIGTSTLPSLADVAGVYKFQSPAADATYFISYINDLADFYVQQSDLNADELASTVASACGSGQKIAGSVSRGTPCVAKDSLYQAWNRAIVTDILENDMAKILFLDYGSSETVKITTLKQLPDSLHETPVAAMKCSLSPLPEKYTEFTELFKTITTDREVSVTPLETGVSILMDGIPLTDVFDKATHYSTLSFKTPTLADTCNVYVTSPEDPRNVWVQLAEYEEQLEGVMAALVEYCPEAPALYTTSPGTVCAALFPDDETWYRARITKQEADKCTVQFVDYGNSCEVTKGNLKLLNEEQMEMPVNSVVVSLANIRPETGTKFADAVIDKLFEVTTEQLCEMKLTSYRASQHVTLSVEGVDVATSVCEAEGAKAVPDPDVLEVPALSREEGEATVYIAHVEEVGQIFGQVEEHFEAFEELGAVTTDQLVSVDYPFKPLHCWAEWEGAMYRAILTEFSATHADVWFLDYGNKDKVTIANLYYLKPEHVELPGLAIPFQLAGIKPVRGEWDAAAKTTLSGLVLEKSAAVTLPALSNTGVTSESVTVEMVIEEKSVSEQLKNNRVARSAVQPPIVTSYLPHEFSEEISVFCTDVEGTKVSCQLGDQLEEIQEKLQATLVEGHPDYLPEEITPDMPCVCKFYDDGTWYRSVVKEINGDKVAVQFVDYGNTQDSKRSEIQLLPSEFNYPPQVFKVDLDQADKLSDVDKMFLPKVMMDPAFSLSVKIEGDMGSFFLTTVPAEEEEEKKEEEKTVEEGEEKVESAVEVSEPVRTDVITATIAYSQSVGYYPPFAPLEADHVVYSSEIVGPEEFYVQLDGSDEVLGAISEKMTKCQTDKMKIETPFVGQPVLAIFDGDLYRGIVIHISDKSKYKVRFVDYGNSSVVDTVYEILPVDVLYAPQAVRCALDQVQPLSGETVFSDKARAKLSELIGEDKDITIVATRQDTDTVGVLDTLYVSIQHDERNTRMKLLQDGLVGESDTSIGECELVKIPTKPVEVIVTHIENENLFFGYRTGGEKEEKDEDDEEVEEEEEDDLVDANVYVTEYQTVLEDTAPPVVESVNPGDICVTRWQGALYRAVVIWVQHKYAKVRFMDYGNTWYTSTTELLDCPEPFRGPGLAVPFCGKIEDKQVSADTDYLLEKQPSEDETKIISVSVSVPKPKLLKFRSTKVEIGVPQTLYVCVPLSHGQFYCQSEEGGESLVAIETMIGDVIKSRAPVPNMVVDAPVLGQYENVFYRGKIVEVLENGAAKVLFVDYGNTEVCKSMVNVTPELMKLLVVGINCQLEGISFVGVDAKVKFDELVAVDAELTITPASYDKETKQYTVTALTGEEINVATVVAEIPSVTEFTRAERTFPLNTVMPMYCSKFNSPTDFCCQVQTDEELIATIATQTAACVKVNLAKAEVGTVCLAKNDTDSFYYRGLVTAVADDIYTVLYVDYGYRETVPLSALYDVSAELAAHKICGIQCCEAFARVQSHGCTWDPETLAKLIALYDQDTQLDVSVVSEEDGLFKVHLMCKDDNILNYIPAESVEKPKKFSYPRFTEPQDLYVSVNSGPKQFFGQREQDGPRLAVLQRLVDATDQHTTDVLEHPAPGSVCIGKSVESEGLFRAQVLSVEGETARVIYVDYGNEEEIATTSLYNISDSVLAIPVYAVPLCLDAVDEITEEALAAFSELCVEDSQVTVTPVTWDASLCLCTVQFEGKDVKDLVKPEAS